MRDNIRKIVVTGPESTGKSTLSQALAQHYVTRWVPEFAREYLTASGRNYNRDDMEAMARGQVLLEDTALQQLEKNALLFIDTDLITYKIWYQHKYGQVPPWIINEIKKRSYDLYLLCYPDLPWEDDILRENPGKGEYFFNWYERELKQSGTSYVVIKGNENVRLEEAIKAIDSY